MAKEIERKFLIRSVPEELPSYPSEEISQGYIVISDDGTEIRLRKKGHRYFQTIKTGRGKTRTENEIELTEDQFSTIWPTTGGRRVEKTRYVISESRGKIELDIYHGALQGLVTAEVEFPTEEASNQFNPPAWFDFEVTEDERYKNQNLAIHGVPKN